MKKVLFILLSSFVFENAFAFYQDIQTCKQELLSGSIIQIQKARKGRHKYFEAGHYTFDQINVICEAQENKRICLEQRACSTCGYIIEKFMQSSDEKNTHQEMDHAAVRALDQVINECKRF